MAAKTSRVTLALDKLMLDEVNPRFAKPMSQDDMLSRLDAYAEYEERSAVA